MITGAYSVIRTAEVDDAAVLARLYSSKCPRTFMLDSRREHQLVTVNDLREVLGRKNAPMAGRFYAIEDIEGVVRGFCALKGSSQEVGYSEIMLGLLESADYQAPLATETMAFLKRMAFFEKRLDKILAQTLSAEQDFKDLLAREGFMHNGSQREVVFTQGQYFDIDTFTLVRSDFTPGA